MEKGKNKRKSETARPRRQSVTIKRVTEALTRTDVGYWHHAWQMAINTDNPDRRRLLDCYRDAMVDTHLSGCISQRTGFVMARSFKLTQEDGNADEKALDIFDAPWFKDFCRYTLESIFYGHSLIELGEVRDTPAGRSYSDVALIPRRNVRPELGIVATGEYEDSAAWVRFDDPAFAQWLIPVGRPDDLGLLLKAVPQTVAKKNMAAFWDTFGEIFGMPMRVAKTSTRDEKEVDQLERMMENATAKQWMIAGADTEIDFVESSRGDAYNVYDKRIERANAEISKLILGQTMTIEDGASLSQSQTHLQVLKNIIEADADFLRDTVNNLLLPRMERHGFPVAGLRFDWDEHVDYTPEQQNAIDRLAMENYEVDPAYFIERYGIPVTGKKETGYAPGLAAGKKVNPAPFFD